MVGCVFLNRNTVCAYTEGLSILYAFINTQEELIQIHKRAKDLHREYLNMKHIWARFAYVQKIIKYVTTMQHTTVLNVCHCILHTVSLFLQNSRQYLVYTEQYNSQSLMNTFISYRVCVCTCAWVSALGCVLGDVQCMS